MHDPSVTSQAWFLPRRIATHYSASSLIMSSSNARSQPRAMVSNCPPFPQCKHYGSAKYPSLHFQYNPALIYMLISLSINSIWKPTFFPNKRCKKFSHSIQIPLCWHSKPISPQITPSNAQKKIKCWQPRSIFWISLGFGFGTCSWVMFTETQPRFIGLVTSF